MTGKAFLKRIVSTLLTATLTVTSLSVSSFSEENDTSENNETICSVSVGNEFCTEQSDMIQDSDEALWKYLQENTVTRPKLMKASKAKGADRYQGISQRVYNEIVKHGQKIAAGEEDETLIEVDIQDMFEGKQAWDAQDLGMSEPIIVETDGNGNIIGGNVNDAIAGWREKCFGDVDVAELKNAALRDKPEYFFWIDSIYGMSYGCENFNVNYNYEKQEFEIVPNGIRVVVQLYVSRDYADENSYELIDGYEVYTKTDKDKIKSINVAADNAKQVVTDASELKDIEKLAYYRDAICNYTNYNYEAADGKYYIDYGDPWQLIYVFDGNEETNVVCEGYAKAFKYLCDMTAFDNSDIYAYIVSGLATLGSGSGSGPHMWNLLHMDDDRVYLADVSTCDGIDEPGKNVDKKPFLVPAALGNVEDGFLITTGTESWYHFEYIYDEDTRAMYSDEELKLSLLKYGEELNRYTLNFDTGVEGLEVASEEKDEQSRLTEPEISREGYTLTGWYRSASQQDETTKWDFGNDTIQDNMTLYAAWTANEYTLSFDSCGGTEQQSKRITYDAAYGEMPVPERKYYVFLGWFTDPETGDEITSQSVHSHAGDVTLYAHWQSYPKLSVPEYNITRMEWDSTEGNNIGDDAKIELSVNEPDAKIYYTTDGRVPVMKPEQMQEDGSTVLISDELLYTGPLSVENVTSDKLIIHAFGVKEGFIESDTVTWEFVICDNDWGDIKTEDRPMYPEPEKIPEGLWLTGVEDVDYSGTAVTFDNIRVYDGRILLKNGTDYTIGYKNNKNAGSGQTASVIITGKGNYSGSIVKNFAIRPIDISEGNEDIFADEIRINEGQKASAIKPVIYRRNGKDRVTLSGKTDYNYTYDGVQVTVTGKNNYTGTRTIPVEILPSGHISVDKLNISVADVLYTGNKAEPAITVKNGKTVLKAGKDYNYSFEGFDNAEVGNGYVTVQGLGIYHGERTVSFKISGIPMSSVKVNGLNASYVYSGQSVKQDTGLSGMYLSFTEGKGATAKTITLKEDEDYKVRYSDNVAAGTATVTFEGIGGYTGSIKKSFKIQPYNLNEKTHYYPDGGIATISITDDSERAFPQDYAYVKNGVTPKVQIKLVYRKYNGSGNLISYRTEILKEGTDYTLGYTNNANVTADYEKKPAVIKITGRGNFSGTRAEEKFRVVPQNINAEGITATAADKVYANRKSNFTTNVTLCDSNGKALAAGKDYEKQLHYYYVKETRLADGTVRLAGSEVPAADTVPQETELMVTAEGKGNYSGTISANYRITVYDIAKAAVTVIPQYYTGREVCPGQNQLVVKYGKTILGRDDYEITGYSGNVQKGTASLTIHGMGSYGGTKTVKFNIGNRSVVNTIIFNGNGSTSGTMKNINFVGKQDLTIPVNAYKREHYVFDGWNSKSDGTGISYSDGEKVTLNGEYGNNYVMYAQWKPEKYYIRYHLGGGSNSPDNTRAEYDGNSDTFSIASPQEENWPTGYSFGGWYMDNTYKEKIAEVKNGMCKNLDLYAKWIPYTYTVVFDASQADKGYNAPEEFSYGVPKQLNACKQSKEGYAFMGWALSEEKAEAGEVSFKDSDVVDEYLLGLERKNSAGNTRVLYPVWRNKFTVTFDTDDKPEKEEIDYEYGTGIAAADMPKASRDGYSFDGWYMGDKKIKSIGKKDAGDYELTAKWIPYKYTVRYDGNGADSGTMKAASSATGEDYVLQKNEFAKKGFAFAGWNTEKDGNGTWIDEGDTVNIIPNGKKDIVYFYAQWKQADHYDIRFELNGGSAEGIFYEYEYNHPGGYSLPNPTRSGCTFGGWFSDSQFKKRVYSISQNAYGDMVLYAKWNGPKYKVTFNANAPAGTKVSGKMAVQSMQYATGKALTKNAYKIPGYTMTGWSTDKSATEAAYNDAEVFYGTDGCGDVTLYAIWEKDEFSISYVNTDEVSNSGNPESFYVDTESIILKEPERLGDTFLGWYSDAKYKKKVTSIPKGTVGNVILYAKWSKVNYTIGYDLNAGNDESAVLHTENAGYSKSYNSRYDNGYLMADAARDGYSFGGWYKEPSCKNAVGPLITSPYVDMIVYAKWIPIE